MFIPVRTTAASHSFQVLANFLAVFSLTESSLQHCRSQQVGFTSGRGITDHISIIRLLIQKAYEYRRGNNLYIAFTDLKTAFDGIDRNAMCFNLQAMDVSIKLVYMIKLQYSHTESCVCVNGDESNFLQISCGVRQGYPAAPHLFNSLIEYLMTQVCDCIPGVYLNVYYLKYLKYADDMAIFEYLPLI